ncbi:hypothetical protein [Flavobacterium sp. AG291]|uniref:hypothetical protein n=1 Tax=Flavobacterium sp. AG291 TaxID=2184000 RepID=UPI000E0A18FA|nr:hypothetical protein [Flavobacterium sp. AG291]RDI06969.1 hypothetical protein DEU42_11368 [Flavobacterium sp. AG291]
MKTIISILALLATLHISAQDKDFKETSEYIVGKVKKYSLRFNEDTDLKVDSVLISETGEITLNYNKKKGKDVKDPYQFNIFNLNKEEFYNDLGKCKCGITLYNDTITFWVKKEEGVSIKVVDSQAEMLYKAFVYLQTLKEKKDRFARE